MRCDAVRCQRQCCGFAEGGLEAWKIDRFVSVRFVSQWRKGHEKEAFFELVVSAGAGLLGALGLASTFVCVCRPRVCLCAVRQSLEVRLPCSSIRCPTE